LGAVRSSLHGGSLDDVVAANGDMFVYPPLAGLLLVPLAGLPDLAVAVLWTLLSRPGAGACGSGSRRRSS
jgi:hypothetical protein